MPPGYPRVVAVCDYVHSHLTFAVRQQHRPEHGRRRLPVRLRRLPGLHPPRRVVLPGAEHPGPLRLRLPARDGRPGPRVPMDFAAWMEVWLGDRWWTFDPRNNEPRKGRVLIGRGRDAADVAMCTTYGAPILEIDDGGRARRRAVIASWSHRGAGMNPGRNRYDVSSVAMTTNSTPRKTCAPTTSARPRMICTTSTTAMTADRQHRPARTTGPLVEHGQDQQGDRHCREQVGVDAVDDLEALGATDEAGGQPGLSDGQRHQNRCADPQGEEQWWTLCRRGGGHAVIMASPDHRSTTRTS